MVCPPYSFMAISVSHPAAANTVVISGSFAIFCPPLGLIIKQAFFSRIKTPILQAMISGLYVIYHEKSSGRVSSAIPLLTLIEYQKVKKKSPAGVLKKELARL